MGSRGGSLRRFGRAGFRRGLGRHGLRHLRDLGCGHRLLRSPVGCGGGFYDLGGFKGAGSGIRELSRAGARDLGSRGGLSGIRRLRGPSTLSGTRGLPMSGTRGQHRAVPMLGTGALHRTIPMPGTRGLHAPRHLAGGPVS
ncbi:hypothetical protein, partial [Streptomyces sp. KR55]|uniref:hypothetical protein n=1 Tax=Streptomyces sp. KR55 TaxID=3457425 RepID=UPI003FD0BC85